MAENELTSLGEFRILTLLGSGGFGEVYKAEDTTLGREVALKILHPQLLSDPDFVRRFGNDARAAAQLDHPHIVTVFGMGEDQGRLYIPMQYCPGGSLAARIKERGPLPYAQAVEIVAQIADALDYAHRLGFVHRDVKPSNILFDAHGNAVLADFGLVKSVESSVIARSSTGGIVGTPAYIAPEIWDDQPATASTDIYALGCVLYEMLTGDVLFGRSSTLATMKAHVAPRRFPARWAEDVPASIITVLTRALAPAPEDRYPSAGALAAVLAGSEERAPMQRAPRVPVIVGRISVALICLLLAIGGVAGASRLGFLNSRAAQALMTVQVITTATRPATDRRTETEAPVMSPPPTAAPTVTPRLATQQPTIAASPTLRPTDPATPTPTPTGTPIPPSPTQALSIPTPDALAQCTTVTGTFGAVWQAVGSRLGCSEGSVITGLIAEEAFEGGMMFWREPFDYAQALVAFSSGTWQIFGHTPYVEGSPDFSCLDAQTPAQCPPTPKRGFGMMWCDISAIRSGLGNAVNCERGYIGEMQQFEEGFALRSDSGIIYVFYGDGMWERR